MPGREIITQEWVSAAAGGPKLIEVRYRPQPPSMRQRRFQGHEIFIPDIDLDQFQVRAVLDYVELGFKTASPTQLRWLLVRVDAMGLAHRPHVKQKDGDKVSGTGSTWWIRFQDIEPRKLVEVAAKIADQFKLNGPVLVVEAEISVDFYHKANSIDERQRLVSVLRHTVFPENALDFTDFDRARTAAERKSLRAIVPQLDRDGEEAVLNPQRNAPGPLDHTFYIGPRKPKHGVVPASMAWQIRVQDKIADTRSRTIAVSLPPDKHRARIEVTLREASLRDLGIETLDKFLTFPVTKLQGAYFSFWLPGFKSEISGRTARSAAAAWFAKHEVDRFRTAGILGLRWHRAMDQKKHLGRQKLANDARVISGKKPKRLSSGRFSLQGPDKSFSELTSRIQAALKDLKARLQRASKS